MFSDGEFVLVAGVGAEVEVLYSADEGVCGDVGSFGDGVKYGWAGVVFACVV